MSTTKRVYGLSIFFSVLAFWVYFKAFQWVFNQFFSSTTVTDIISVIIVLIVIVPVSLMTGRKIAAKFVEKTEEKPVSDE
ncbi:hypothetical protein QTL97_07080 [Sporosarcina thermotolerans]|uniref:Uncharacterized protein n=1 Tax=Sporosarcina thermotolerans TaxID=633404 RepID=A0AAW9A7U7_9BACL|nr:hypothetical protein [Sporosarcina thermotolerans]MDW0116693.1 hypothetical protein [Sporosarcina thermotolerans]WHT48887.1 hypothetical protein QNH10_04010 [Sporosarcina thermotolerans]